MNEACRYESAGDSDQPRQESGLDYEIADSADGIREHVRGVPAFVARLRVGGDTREKTEEAICIDMLKCRKNPLTQCDDRSVGVPDDA